MTNVRLSALAGGRDNNLNLIRMVAAASVCVSHAYPITEGSAVAEPLEGLLGRSLGSLAVLVFFAISGFLITRSFDRGGSVWHWVKSRVLRLFPGLFVVLVLTVALLGPAFTTLPLAGYLSSPETLSYLPRNLSLAFMQYPLPGVFDANPYGPAINGSLWSLFHEVLCYIGVLVAGLAGVLSRPRHAAALFLAYGIVYVLATPGLLGVTLPDRVLTLRELSLPFFFGAAAYVWRENLPLGWLPAVIGTILLALLRPTVFFDAALAAWICYVVLCLAYLPRGAVRQYNRLGDYSYGIYIYAFPWQQAVVHLFGPMEPVTNMVLSAPFILVSAILSWHYIESPALRLVRRAPRITVPGP